MTGPRAYLDHNALQPLRPEARQAALAVLGLGNPSSVHAEGRAARAAIERARLSVARLVGASPDGVVFTSGGTEANNAVLRPGATLDRSGRAVTRLVVSAVEHASVLDGHGFAPEAVRVLPVDGSGLCSPAALAAALDEAPDVPTVVSVQWANSETGVVQPLAALAALARERGAVVHSDAVGALGRVPVDVERLGLDGVSLSAGKIGGLPGAGALFLRPERRGPALRLLGGGGQEGGLRSGTENLAGIAAFGAAADAARLAGDADREVARALRDAVLARLRAVAPALRVVGEGAERLPNTLAFLLPGLRAETALIALDLAGVAVSSGSACSSGKVGRSHVLAAMGMPPDEAACALRLSVGPGSTAVEIERFAAAFERLVGRLYGEERARAA